MPIFLLASYIALIFVRPMDWWPPVLGWQLVTVVAIALLLITFPRILNELMGLWRSLSPVRVSVALLFGTTISWIYPFWFTGMWNSFNEFSRIITMYLLIVLLARQPRAIQVIIWTLIVCVAWLAVHGILQIHRGYGFGSATALLRHSYNANGELIRSYLQTRAYGTFDDPNDMCLVFILAIPLLYAQFRATTSPLVKTLAISLIPLNAYAAWLTNSRGGVVGIFGMVAAHAIVRTKSRIRRWIVASMAVSLITVIAPARFSFAVDVGRVNLWGDGLDMFKRYPIFGVGMNAFAQYSTSGEGGQVAHNTYITALAELGLVGYVPFFLLLYLTMSYLRRASNLGKIVNPTDQALLTGFFSALSGYLTAIYFLTRNYTHLLYLLLALALCQTIIVCQKTGQFTKVFGSWRADRNRALVWCAASIPIMWITVRVANRMAGR